jgi:hypothetical protein
MKKYILVLVVLLFYWHVTFATWSIIVVDPKTNEIGIAGASCSFNCYGIGHIVPGMGSDRRCGEQKATSAFIIVAKPGDKKPYLKLNIFGQKKGGQNAVIMIRKKFEKWKRRHSR